MSYLSFMRKATCELMVGSPDKAEGRPGSSSFFRREQLSRLLQIIIALQSERRPNARRLAELCEVSRRTIFRDLDAIEAAGISVEYDAARQGYRMGGSSPHTTVGLSEREALALLMIVNQVRACDTLCLVRDAEAGVMKLIQGLPAQSRRRVQAVVPAIAGSVTTIRRPRTSLDIRDKILEALGLQVQIRLIFRETGCTMSESTSVTPYRLYHGRSGWDLIGRSTLHRRIRRFPVSTIEQVVLTEESAVIPPRFDAERWLRRTWSGEPGPDRHEVRLRFSGSLVSTIREGVWHPSQRIELSPDGRIDLLLTLDRPGDLTGWILGHGDHVEVISPDELRRMVSALAIAIAGKYAEPRPAIQNGVRPG
jgi:predicted DNA-binding transcriptional regulator YafY